MILFACAVCLIAAILIGFMTAGDAFLAYLSRELRLDVSYKNHSDFVSCFVLRFIKLRNPVFVLKDFGVVIGCNMAYIEPRFDRLIRDHAVVLRCNFENATLLNMHEKIGEGKELFSAFGGQLSVLLDALMNIHYNTMHAELVLYEDRVAFPFYTAHSKDLKLYASGMVKEIGDFDLRLKIYLSPKLVGQFPETLRAIFTQESGGWASYSVNVESGTKKPFLKVDSDRIKFQFEKIEVK